jgi:hypothetical protein
MLCHICSIPPNLYSIEMEILIELKPNNTYTLNGNSFGSWTTAPSAGNQEGYWYEMVYLNKIPTIAEYNALVTYLGTKWGVSCGTLTNYN